MKRVTPFVVLGLALTIAGTTVSAQEKLDRTSLPVAEPKPPTYSELDARNVKPPPRFQVRWESTCAVAYFLRVPWENLLTFLARPSLIPSLARTPPSIFQIMSCSK